MKFPRTEIIDRKPDKIAYLDDEETIVLSMKILIEYYQKIDNICELFHKI